LVDIVCVSMIGLLSAFSVWSILVQKIAPQFILSQIAAMIHSLGFIILACSSSKYRFYKLFWQSRIPLILSQIVNMVTSSSLYLFDLIPWPSGKTSQFLMRVIPMQFSSFIFQNYFMSPQATSLGTFVSMHNLPRAMAHHPFFYQVFSLLFLWYFFPSYTIRQNLLITFWWIWILYSWTLFLQLVIPEDVATDH